MALMEQPLMDRQGVTSGSSDVDLINHCMKLFYAARDARKLLSQEWYDNYQILHNKRSGWALRPQGNAPRPPEIKPIISALCAWMTDTEPIFDALPAASPFTPFYDTFTDLADDLRMCLQSLWQNTEVDAEVEKLLWDVLTYGVGYLKTTWDSGLWQGLGDAAIKRVDPFSFYPDPSAHDMNDATYFVEVKTMAMQDVETRWPGSRSKLTTGMTYRFDGDESPSRTSDTWGARLPMANPAAIAPSTDNRFGLPGQSRDSVIHDPGVTIFEFWLKVPCKMDAIPREDGSITDANPAQPDDERWYDSWRCIVIAAGREILLNEPVESFWATGTHPYDRCVPESTGEWYADSMVRLLATLQATINRNLRAITSNLDLVGNPVFLERAASNIPRAKAVNQPGQRLQVQSDVNNEARWLEPPSLPTNYMELVQYCTQRMEAISGLSGIIRGATPTGRNAQGVLDSVSEAAFVRVRNTLRNMERCLISAGNKAASHICQFYDSPRIVALVGPGGEKSARALTGMNFYVPTEQGRVPLRFQVRVDLGSQQATSRSTKFQEATTMYSLGLIDGEAALQLINIPNWKAVVGRMRELQAANGTLGQPPGARAAAGH